MAEIRETVTVETADAQSSLDELKSKTGDADKALDTLKDTADNVDKAEVSVPVDAPGAKQAADDLDQVDQKARAAGDGAKVGVSGISDLTGPLGDASGKASELGQAMESAGNIATSAAAQMGATPEQIGKLTGALGGAGTAIAIGAAAWTLYNQKQDEAKKKADELKKSINDVLEATAKGDSAAAADKLIEKFGPLISDIQKLTGLSVPDIVESLTGETGPGTGRLDAVNQALLDLGTKGADGLREKARDLQGAWKTANSEFQRTQELKSEVTAAFDALNKKADESGDAADDTATRWEGMANRIAAATNSIVPTGYGGNPASTLNFDPAVYLAAGGSVVNLYPPANTPIAVDQAAARQFQIQGPR